MTGPLPPPEHDRHTLNYAAATHPGLVRSNNEDSYFASNRLIIVADGMGGHVAGEYASRLVVDAFTPLGGGRMPSDIPEALRHATEEGNSAIAEAVAADPELDGMGTTVTAMLFDGNRAGLVHIGDSRAYLYRSGVLHQLTHDDTFVQWLVDDGRITEGQAHEHPQRNLVLRALTGTDIESSVTVRTVAEGDRYLLCSDGLSGVVIAENIAEALAHPDPAIAAETLVSLTLAGGAPDNVTVIVADVSSTGEVVTAAAGELVADAATSPKDVEATGEFDHLTREMPRVPLPPIPEGPGQDDDESAEFDDDLAFDDDTEFDDDYDDDDVPQDSAAAKTEPTLELERPASPDRKHRGRSSSRKRTWAIRSVVTVVALLLLGAVTTGTTMWVRSQYYVSDHAGDVAIYRGVDGSLFGWRFSTLEEDSCEGADVCPPLTMLDLQPGARDVVAKSITAGSLAEARDVMARLTTVLLPECPPLQGADDTTEPAQPEQPTTTSAAPTTGSTAPESTDRPSSPNQTGSPNQTSSPGQPNFPASTPTQVTITHTVTARPLPPAAAIPGVNCRIVP